MSTQDRPANSSLPEHSPEEPPHTLLALVCDRLRSRPAAAHSGDEPKGQGEAKKNAAEQRGDDTQPAGDQRATRAENANLSKGESLTSVLLRERCRSSDWHPDPGSLMIDEALDSTIGREEFRRLRTYLYEVRRKVPLQRLLISSALSGEGKTFVSANLAQAMAFRPNESVLVVDADLRLSRLHRPLGASAEPGLSEYLQGDADLFSILQRGPTENLFFIAGGMPRKNPADLIGNGKLEALLQRLAPAFDWIVLDSPPALLVTDAELLASLCDGVLLVVRAGVTQLDMARKALQIFRNKHLLGTVLNGSQSHMPYADYYGQSPATAPKKGKRRKSR